MLLKDKTALITGCNRGIGKAILETFAENGADIFACVRKETEEFNERVKSLSEKNGVEIIPLCFDMRDNAAMKSAMMTIRKTRKKIDVLVNNAAMCPPTACSFQMTPVDKIREVFDVNFFATLQLTQYVLKFMRESGSIINVASMAAFDGDEGFCSYAASKAALIGFTRNLSRELGKQNIRVNAVAPGLTDTDMGHDHNVNGGAENFIKESTLGRWGNPKEVAGAILFLASDLSSFVTGEVIRVKGGQRV